MPAPLIRRYYAFLPMPCLRRLMMPDADYFTPAISPDAATPLRFSPSSMMRRRFHDYAAAARQLMPLRRFTLPAFFDARLRRGVTGIRYNGHVSRHAARLLPRLFTPPRYHVFFTMPLLLPIRLMLLRAAVDAYAFDTLMMLPTPF